MPSAWRIVKRSLAARAFDGEGARLHGGRWNSPGVPVVYLATSRSLALLEILVHLDDAEVLRRSYVLIEVEYGARFRRDLTVARRPEGWDESPAPATTRAVGDAWVERAESPLLGVPSAIVPAEFNLLLNPRHPDVRRLKIGKPEPLRIDPRRIRRK